MVRKGKAVAVPVRAAYAPPKPKIEFATAEHPHVIPAAQAPEQAAVDATMVRVIRESEAAVQPPTAAPAPAPVAEDATAKQAARDLLKFLLKTGRFGTMKDRPAEVKAAQLALGVKPDGIVGPKTRAAAARNGVALPPIK